MDDDFMNLEAVWKIGCLVLIWGKPAGQQTTNQLGYISTQLNSVTTQSSARSIQLQINWVTTPFRGIYSS